MKLADLEDLAAVADLMPPCPVKAVGHEELNVFGPFAPIAPVPVSEDSSRLSLEPRRWEYRVC